MKFCVRRTCHDSIKTSCNFILEFEFGWSRGAEDSSLHPLIRSAFLATLHPRWCSKRAPKLRHWNRRQKLACFYFRHDCIFETNCFQSKLLKIVEDVVAQTAYEQTGRSKFDRNFLCPRRVFIWFICVWYPREKYPFIFLNFVCNGLTSASDITDDLPPWRMDSRFEAAAMLLPIMGNTQLPKRFPFFLSCEEKFELSFHFEG